MSEASKGVCAVRMTEPPEAARNQKSEMDFSALAQWVRTYVAFCLIARNCGQPWAAREISMPYQWGSSVIIRASDGGWTLLAGGLN